MIMLTPTQEHWDNKTLDYDLEKFDWPSWALGVIQEITPQVTELETLHEVLSPTDIVKVSSHVQNSCSRKDFMERFDAFVAENIPQRIDNKRYMIQRQGTLRVVIPNQAKVGRRLAFHQGIFVGNGRGCRTIWTPFTEARGTNTMQMLELDISRELTKQVLAEKWSLDRFEEECMKHAFPITLKPGQSHLFFQEHIHGNVNNNEGYTRVSMDMRILVEGEEFGRRYPGGFMRFPGDHEVAEINDYTGKEYITYAGWNSEFSKHLPLPMQRATINEYCTRNKISYNSYEFENEHMDWQPGLEHYINKKPDGIVLCSMYALTDNIERRNEILNLALERGVELHFANELCSLKTKDDLEKIEMYLNFAVQKSGPYVWE
jgi:sporadic carbohydrate cluster protein (TIGR04323 family)|tara:strand:- start:1126 stop:2250 length:1125 start_codon:yes stop_codon:yes gene_type:complete